MNDFKPSILVVTKIIKMNKIYTLFINQLKALVCVEMN